MNHCRSKIKSTVRAKCPRGIFIVAIDAIDERVLNLQEHLAVIPEDNLAPPNEAFSASVFKDVPFASYTVYLVEMYRYTEANYARHWLSSFSSFPDALANAISIFTFCFGENLSDGFHN